MRRVCDRPEFTLILLAFPATAGRRIVDALPVRDAASAVAGARRWVEGARPRLAEVRDRMGRLVYRAAPATNPL